MVKKVDAEVLPALDNSRFADHQFTPVTVDDNDRTVTIQDLNILNGAMEMGLQAYQGAKSLLGLIALSEHMMRLVQCRRGVMKLPYGASKGTTRKGRTIEVLD